MYCIFIYMYNVCIGMYPYVLVCTSEPFPTNFDSPILCILCRTMHSLFLLHRFTLA